MFKRWRAWRERRRNRCRISEEWGGLFIGRRYCSKHQYYWDPVDPPCPGTTSRSTWDPSIGVWRLDPVEEREFRMGGGL